MHKLLQTLFKQRGINGLEDLKEDEKEQFDRWQRILSEGDVTLDSLVRFCETQLSRIDKEWEKPDNSKEKNERLITQRIVYKSIAEAIKAPQANRLALEKYLNSLIT